jgi:short-subunit dehydrogenase
VKLHSGSIVCDSHERLRRAVEVNLLSPMELARQVLAGMIERRRGHIVNVSSLAASAVFPGLVAYSATKAGLAHFTAGLRTDLRGTPIKVTLVDLGPVRTDALATAQSYPLALASYRRAYRLRLLVDVAPERAAGAIIGAIERNQRAVRIPRRAAPLGQMVELPRRAVEVLLTGLDRAPRRDQEHP